MDDQRQQIEYLVYQCVAHYLEAGLTEIAPLEVFAPTMHFPEINLRVTRLWNVALGEHTCLVVQGIQDGQVVYLARG